MKQIYYPREIIKQFNICGLNYKIFINHEEVYFDIINNNYTDITLLHMDAHSDIMEYMSDNVNPGNWINHLILTKRLSEINWINTYKNNNNPEFVSVYDVTCKYSETNYDIYKLKNKIDLVYYTISPEWAPKNNLVEDFKRYMKK